MKNIIVLLLTFTVAFAASAVEIVKGTPAKDGWDKAKPMPFYLWKESGTPPMETRARFMYDDDQLYIRVFFAEPNINEARQQPKIKHDGNVWDNDCLEIFIAEPGSKGKIYQFVCDVHNSTAELVWNDPKFAAGITWNGYWSSHVKYSDNSYTFDISIPWRTIGIVAAKDGQIAINLTRHRTIHPWGRYVLAKNTGKLLEPQHFFSFKPLQIKVPAVEAKVSAPAAAVAGTNSLACEISNRSTANANGSLQLLLATPDGDKLLAQQQLRLAPGKKTSRSLNYSVATSGAFPVKLMFVDAKGKNTLLWVDRIIFNPPLDISTNLLTTECGSDCHLFIRDFRKDKRGKITISLTGNNGKIAASRTINVDSSEYFLPIPSAKAAPGWYTVTISAGNFSQSLKLLISRFLSQ